MSPRAHARAGRLADRLVRPRPGQTNVELGAVLVFVSIAAVAPLVLIGDGVLPMFSSAAAGF